MQRRLRFQSHTFQVFPNPFNQELTIKIEEGNDKEYKIYNFERIERDDDNYNDEYKRLVDALNLIEKSNFFIPDDIEETNSRVGFDKMWSNYIELYKKNISAV